MIGAATLALAMLAAGIQFGWQPLDSGGTEYIVQVEPQLVDAFRKNGFTSEIPPQRDIRRIRIVVGDGPLPHQGQTPPPAALPDSASAQPLHGAVVSAPKSGGPDAVEKAGAMAPANGEPPPAHADAPATPTTASDREPPAAAPPAARPWLALLAVAGGLVVSLSGNVYLGWVHMTTRSRYLGLVEKLRGKRATDAADTSPKR